MNALTRTYSDFASALTGSEKSPREGQRRLYAAIALYGFSDSVSVDHAFEAYFEDKPAYWTTADYHSQRAIGLMDALNRGCEFGIALAANYPAHCTKYRPSALDTLVPLNIKAANALVKAYDALGIWRDVEELEARRRRDVRRAA